MTDLEFYRLCEKTIGWYLYPNQLHQLDWKIFSAKKYTNAQKREFSFSHFNLYAPGYLNLRKSGGPGFKSPADFKSPLECAV